MKRENAEKGQALREEGNSERNDTGRETYVG